MKYLLLIFCCSLLICTDAHAQVTVRKSGDEKTRIDWSGFASDGSPAAREFVTTLQRALARSGWFLNVESGRGEVLLTGRVVQQGNALRAECAVVGSVTQRAYLNHAYGGRADQPRILAFQVADAITKAVTGNPGMAAARMVLVGTRTGKKELYLAASDGGDLMQLTRDNSISLAPTWGPGGKITYTSFRRGFPDVYMIDVQSGQRQAVAAYSGLNTGGAISPDGRDMALILSKEGSTELFIKNIASGRLTRLTTPSRAALASPSWSPDGRQIVFVSDQSGRPQLYTVSRDGGRPQRLTSRGAENVAPHWGANGKIAHASRVGSTFQIAVIDPATRDVQYLQTGDGANYEDPAWAPNGRHIACTRTLNRQSKVYLLDTLGDPAIALTDYAGDWMSPSWSP